MDYLYDETFNGFLTCIYAHYYEERATGIHSMYAYQENLLNPYQLMITDEEKALKVGSAISEKLSTVGYAYVYDAFLSNDTTKEMKLLHYIRLGFKIGQDILNYHTHPVVLPVHKLARLVNHEVHKMIGFLRFIEVENILYAPFESDHYILPKLADHFTDRFKNENFIIHDTKRNLALVYNKQVCQIWEYTLSKEIPLSEKEKHFRDLWKGYFNHIGIETRKNKKLQQQFVPLKYRKHITEFK